MAEFSLAVMMYTPSSRGSAPPSTSGSRGSTPAPQELPTAEEYADLMSFAMLTPSRSQRSARVATAASAAAIASSHSQRTHEDSPLAHVTMLDDGPPLAPWDEDAYSDVGDPNVPPRAMGTAAAATAQTLPGSTAQASQTRAPGFHRAPLSTTRARFADQQQTASHETASGAGEKEAARSALRPRPAARFRAPAGDETVETFSMSEAGSNRQRDADVAATPELIRGVESQRWHDRPSPASTSALLFPGSRLAPGTLPSTPEERGPAPALSPVMERRPTPLSDTATEAASPRATSFSEGAAARAAGSPENDERKLASSMDLLCSTVKSELLAEFAAARRQLKAQADSRLQAQAEEHARALEAARADGEAHRGLVGTLEANLAKKDAIIENLTEALSRERDKATQARRFHMWQVQLSDRKREHFATVLAERHAKLQAARKAFRGWRLVIENKWKARAERACQTRAQEVCHRLSQDYEGRVRELTMALEDTHAEIERLHARMRDQEENMKKAFMRGVCALNMEAMGAFQGEQSEAPEGPRPRAPPARATVPRPAAPQPHPRSDYETHVTAERAPPSAAPQGASRGGSGERSSGGAQQRPAARAANAVPGSQRPPRARPAAGKEAGVRSVKLQGTPVLVQRHTPAVKVVP